MKVAEINNSGERRLIINLITSDQFCKEVLPLVNPVYFETIYARYVSQWIQEYYEQFNEAPKKNIQKIYHTKKKLINDEEEIGLISDFLISISKEFIESSISNVEYEIKNAIQYLGIKSLEVTRDNLDDAIIEGNKAKGEKIIANYKRVEKPLGQGVDLLTDTSKIIDAFNEEKSIVIKFPGDVGRIIKPINRGEFVTFMGPAARGKSFWLWYTANLGMEQGGKGIYYTLEMTEAEIIRRAWPSIIGKPKETSEIGSAFFEEDDNGKFNIIQKSKMSDGFLLDDTEKLQSKIKRLFRKGKLKIICPEDDFSPDDLIQNLDLLEYYENFIPDFIVIDYLDYMNPPKSFKNNEYRHSLNAIWKNVRDIARNRNIAIITATHTETSTFDADVEIQHASEDKRKMNHVTMAIGLNQTKKEAENNIMRIENLKLREGKKSFQQAVILQCLDLGRVCIDSKLKSEVNMDDFVEEKKIEKDSYKRKNN